MKFRESLGGMHSLVCPPVVAIISKLSIGILHVYLYNGEFNVFILLRMQEEVLECAEVCR